MRFCFPNPNREKVRINISCIWFHDGIYMRESELERLINHHFGRPENRLSNHHFEEGKNREKRNRLFSGSSIQIDMKTVNDKK